MSGSIADVPGILVGCAEDRGKLTGVTVVLCEGGARFAVGFLGSATSTRQADAGRTEHLVDRAHAVCFIGGSAFGLAASGGVMDYLRDRGVGARVRETVIPTVPTAALFDVGATRGERPDESTARRACESASAHVPRGSRGAGCGATVGKTLGPQWLMKGGQGAASRRTADGVIVGALACVNAYGDIISPDGSTLAGARDPSHPDRLAGAAARLGVELRAVQPSPLENTTLALIAVGAEFDKPALARIGRMAAAGMARSISPGHCAFDGDVVFALATGGPSANENEIGHLAALALADAVADAVLHADGFGVIPDRRSVGFDLLAGDD